MAKQIVQFLCDKVVRYQPLRFLPLQQYNSREIKLLGIVKISQHQSTSYRGYSKDATNYTLTWNYFVMKKLALVPMKTITVRSHDHPKSRTLFSIHLHCSGSVQCRYLKTRLFLQFISVTFKRTFKIKLVYNFQRKINKVKYCQRKILPIL